MAERIEKDSERDGRILTQEEAVGESVGDPVCDTVHFHRPRAAPADSMDTMFTLEEDEINPRLVAMSGVTVIDVCYYCSNACWWLCHAPASNGILFFFTFLSL